MLELVDRSDLGSDGINAVQVQVLLPILYNNNLFFKLYIP
jgi:hypothetical protein